MFLKFSFLRLTLLAILPKIFYHIFSLIKYGNFDFFILIKIVLGSLSATFFITLLFILLIEFLFLRLSNNKYLLLLGTLIISILIFNLTPSAYIDYVNMNKHILDGITYYLIDVVSVFTIYFIPSILKNK